MTPDIRTLLERLRGRATRAPKPAHVADDAVDAAPAAPVAAGTGVPPIRRPPMTAGPSWTGIVAAEQPWGAWLQLPDAGTVAVQLTWSDGPQPTLRIADAEGTWCTPDAQPDPPLHTAWLHLPAGWTWISVEAPYAHGQQVRVASWLPVVEQELLARGVS